MGCDDVIVGDLGRDHVIMPRCDDDAIKRWSDHVISGRHDDVIVGDLGIMWLCDGAMMVWSSDCVRMGLFDEVVWSCDDVTMELFDHTIKSLCDTAIRWSCGHLTLRSSDYVIIRSYDSGTDINEIRVFWYDLKRSSLIFLVFPSSVFDYDNFLFPFLFPSSSRLVPFLRWKFLEYSAQSMNHVRNQITDTKSNLLMNWLSFWSS